MRAAFGVVSLLVVLATVGLLAARQLKASSQALGAALPAPSGQGASSPAAAVHEQSRQLQQRVKSDVAKALEAGTAARSEESDR